MPRKPHYDLIRSWKVTISATTSGKVEHLLFDTVVGKPSYGARSRLIECLLNQWVARETGVPEAELPRVPTAGELISGVNPNG